MNRDPFNQPASSGAFNSINSNNNTTNNQTLSQRPSQAQLSSSSSFSASSMSRASNRNSPTAIAPAQFTPSTFATSNPITTAPTPAPVSTTAAMTASTLNSFQSSMFANMAPSHAQSFAHHHDSVTATASASFDTGPGTMLLVRGLDVDINPTSLRYMFMAFNDRLVSYKLREQVEGTPARRTRTVFVHAKSIDVAWELRDKFHGKDGLEVEIVGPASSGPSSSGTSPTTTPAANASQAPRFGVLSPKEISPGAIGSSLRNGNGHAFNSHQRPFSSQSPTENHDSNFNSQPRMSTKQLINDSIDDDDPTQDILRLPYQAENGSLTNSRGPADYYYTTNGHASNGGQRRATAPTIPLAAQMASLSLNTGTNGMPPSQHSMYPQSAHPNTMSQTNTTGFTGYPNHFNYPPRAKERIPPAANPADQNPPCNTLYVGNLPMDAKEDELRSIFSVQRGYKRMCYRTKPNGPMCFVEFEDTTTATRAMNELYGYVLFTSKKGGIRLSFSKNPLGVRASQPGPPGPMGGHHGMMGHGANGFSAPPPGLHPYPAPPPGLGPSRSVSSYGAPPGMTNGIMTNGSGISAVNGSNMTNGASYGPQSTNGNGNNALGIGLGNGTSFELRNEQRGNPWPSTYNSAMTPNPYAASYSSAFSSPTVGGSNGHGPYGRGPRQGSS